MADQEGTRHEEPMEVDEGSGAPTTTPSVEPSQAEWSDTGSPEQRQALPLGTTRRVRPPPTGQPQTGRAEQAHTAMTIDHDYAQPSGSTATITEPTDVQTSIESGEGTALYSTKGTLCTPPPGFERPTGEGRPAQLATAMLVDDCDPAPALSQDEGTTATEGRGAEATPGRVGGTALYSTKGTLCTPPPGLAPAEATTSTEVTQPPAAPQQDEDTDSADEQTRLFHDSSPINKVKRVQRPQTPPQLQLQPPQEQEEPEVFQGYTRLTIPLTEQLSRAAPIERFGQYYKPPPAVNENLAHRFNKQTMIEFIKEMPADETLKWRYYWSHIHNNQNLRAEMHITPVDEPQGQPAILSFQPGGLVRSGTGVNLDLRNLHSHFSIQRPVYDSSTPEDMEWMEWFAEALVNRGFVMPRVGDDRIPIGDAITSTAAWFREARMIILTDEMMGATERHLGALRRSTVVFRWQGLTPRGAQTIIDVLADGTRFLEVVMLIMPYTRYDENKARLEDSTLNHAERIRLMKAPLMKDIQEALALRVPRSMQDLHIVVAMPPATGAPDSPKRQYLEHLTKILEKFAEDAKKNGTDARNVSYIWDNMDCSNKADPLGTIMLQHQFLGYLIEIEWGFTTLMDAAGSGVEMLYDRSGAASLFEFVETTLRAMQREGTPEDHRRALEMMRQYQSENPDLCTPDTNPNLAKAKFPWECAALVASGQDSFIEVHHRIEGRRHEIEQMSSTARRDMVLRVRVEPLREDDIKERESDFVKKKKVLNMLRMMVEQSKFNSGPLSEVAWEQRKISAYAPEEWHMINTIGEQPRQALQVLKGWGGQSNGVQLGEMTPRDLLGAVQVFGVRTFMEGPSSCQHKYVHDMNDFNYSMTIVALMSPRAIKFFLGESLKPLQQKQIKQQVQDMLIAMEVEQRRGITLAEVVIRTGLPLDSMNKLVDQVAMQKFFGIYSHRPADYSPFMLENLDSVSSAYGWVLGRIPRVLNDDELCLFKTLRLYRYTSHGISIDQNCYHALVDNLSYVMRCEPQEPSLDNLVEKAMQAMRQRHQNVEQAIQDKQHYDYNQQRKKEKLQEIPPLPRVKIARDQLPQELESRPLPFQPKTKGEIQAAMRVRRKATEELLQPLMNLQLTESIPNVEAREDVREAVNTELDAQGQALYSTKDTLCLPPAEGEVETTEPLAPSSPPEQPAAVPQQRPVQMVTLELEELERINEEQEKQMREQMERGLIPTLPDTCKSTFHLPPDWLEDDLKQDKPFELFHNPRVRPGRLWHHGDTDVEEQADYESPGRYDEDRLSPAETENFHEILEDGLEEIQEERIRQQRELERQMGYPSPPSSPKEKIPPSTKRMKKKMHKLQREQDRAQKQEDARAKLDQRAAYRRREEQARKRWAEEDAARLERLRVRREEREERRRQVEQTTNPPMARSVTLSCSKVGPTKKLDEEQRRNLDAYERAKIQVEYRHRQEMLARKRAAERQDQNNCISSDEDLADASYQEGQEEEEPSTTETKADDTTAPVPPEDRLEAQMEAAVATATDPTTMNTAVVAGEKIPKEQEEVPRTTTQQATICAPPVSRVGTLHEETQEEP